jgi:hypothetical protein
MSFAVLSCGGRIDTLFVDDGDQESVLPRTRNLIALCALLAACGGKGNRPVCANYADPCVHSCGSTDSPIPSLQDCDGTGPSTCPIDSMSLSTCPPNACAQIPTPCCNETTYDLGPTSCKSDGFWSDCPSGSHSAPARICLPSGLDVADCIELRGMSCSSMEQACSAGLSRECWCAPADAGTGDGGLVWSCRTFI